MQVTKTCGGQFDKAVERGDATNNVPSARFVAASARGGLRTQINRTFASSSSLVVGPSFVQLWVLIVMQVPSTGQEDRAKNTALTQSGERFCSVPSVAQYDNLILA